LTERYFLEITGLSGKALEVYNSGGPAAVLKKTTQKLTTIAVDATPQEALSPAQARGTR
jgi:hypothetical protein